MEGARFSVRLADLVFFSIAFLVAALDQVSKHWVRTNLLPGQSLPSDGWIIFTHVQNTGSAFGMMTGQRLFLTIVALIGLMLIISYYFLSPKSALSVVSLGLILGGAVGNLVDRLSRGYVTDFIDVRLWTHQNLWPNFNVADSCVSVGTVLLLFSLLLLYRNKT